MQQRVDKELVEQRFLKSMNSYDENASVQKKMASSLINHFVNISHENKYNNVLEVGCGTGLLTKEILDRKIIDNYFLNDIVNECSRLIPELRKKYTGTNFQFIHSDAEKLEKLSIPFDLIISNAAFQWMNNLDIFLSKLYCMLTDNGYLVFSTFGKNNLNEINVIEKCSLMYYDLMEIKSLTEKYFHILQCSEESIELLFDSPKDVLNHLKKTGTKGLKKETWNKKRLEEFESAYNSLFRKNNKVTLTFNPIYIVAKRK